MAGQTNSRLAKLEATIEAQSKTSQMDLAKKCADQAASVFSSLGYRENARAEITPNYDEYSNHYNGKNSNCYLEIRLYRMDKRIPNSVTMKYVLDAYDRREVARFAASTEFSANAPKRAPFSCEIQSMSGGPPTTCTSEDDFDQAVKPYLE